MLAQQAGHRPLPEPGRVELHRAPRPARLGERRLGVEQGDPPDPILPERQRQPGQLPAEPRIAGGLRHEQRELLTGRRLGAGQLQRHARDGGRWRGPLQPGEQQALDGLGVGGRFGEALLDGQLRRRPGQGEREVQVETEMGPGRGQAAGRQLLGERAGEPMEDEAQRLQLVRCAARWAVAGRAARGSTRGRNGSISSPRARAWIRAPSSPNRAMSAERASSATAPTRRSPKRASRARMSGSWVSRPDGYVARNAASPPTGTRIGSPGRAWTAAMVAAKRVPAMPARTGEPAGAGGRQRSGHFGRRAARSGGCGRAPCQHPGQTLGEDRFRAPQRLEAVGLDLEQPERRVGRVGRPGKTRAERGEGLECGLGRGPVRLRIRIDEDRLRCQPMRARQRDPPSHAERPGVAVRVDDRPRVPRPAAQHERAGREGLGGARRRQREGEMRSVEVQQSHRGGSVRCRWRGPGRRWGSPRRGGRPGGGSGRDRRPPRRGSGASPADLAGRIDCARPAPPSAGRRCPGRGGSTTAARARAEGRSTRRRRWPWVRPGRAARGRRRATPLDGRARPVDRAGRRPCPADPSSRADRPGRSRSSRSTDRPASRLPAMARPSSRVSGVITTSHSRRTPRATASTGSKVRARSSQATTEPAPWASATSRSARVVRPLEPSPRMATLADRGRPPGPRMASRLANPVGMTRSSGRAAGRGPPSGSDPSSGSAAGASANDPMTRGAAAPHRAWRPATAASTSPRAVVIGRPY